MTTTGSSCACTRETARSALRAGPPGRKAPVAVEHVERVADDQRRRRRRVLAEALSCGQLAAVGIQPVQVTLAIGDHHEPALEHGAGEVATLERFVLPDGRAA